jgi:AcrR family transcriptional regulator
MDGMKTAEHSPRAPALPPDERRAAIINAAVPLLVDRGLDVTTKQVADAAGIAEGTIFRVFRDKEALLGAVIDAAVDGSSAEIAIAAIDRSLPFRNQLEAAVEIMQRRLLKLYRLLSAVAGSEALRNRQPRILPDPVALIDLFQAEQGSLRLDAVTAARALRAVTFAFSHPSLYLPQAMEPVEIVSLFLDGVASRATRRRPASPGPGGGPC